MKSLWKLFVTSGIPLSPHLGWGLLFQIITALAGAALITVAVWFLSASALAGLLFPLGATTFNMLGPAASIRALAISRSVFRYLESWSLHKGLLHFHDDMRIFSFKALMKGPYWRLLKPPPSGLFLNLTRNSEECVKVISDVGVPLAALLSVASVAAVCFWIFFPAFWIYFAVLCAVCGLTVPVIAYWALRKTSSQRIKAKGQATDFSLHFTQAFPDLLAFQQVDREVRKLKGAHEKIDTVQSLRSVMKSCLETLSLAAGFALIVFLIGQYIDKPDSSVFSPYFAAMIFLLIILVQIFASLPTRLLQYLDSQIAAKAILRLAELPTPPPGAIPGHEAFASPEVIPSKQPLIELQGVSLRYPHAFTPVIDNLHLTIKEGEKLAITGPSGSGKTSLLHMIAGLIPPSHGCAFVAGIEPHLCDDASRSRLFSSLLQNSKVFETSLRDNLLLANAGAGDDAMWQALRLCGMQKEALQLRDGLDTVIGEGGVELSAGQRRRLCLARIFLTKAPVILLDEPSEGLDDATRTNVMSGLKSFSHGKTLVYVTHYARELDFADRVLRLT